MEELLAYAPANPIFTIRFDRDWEYFGLPFHVIEQTLLEAHATVIADQAHSMNCTMLCSSGHKYNPLQVCNFVYQQTGGEFCLELNFSNVPLRHMYNQDLISTKGGVYAELRDCDIYGSRKQLSQTFFDKIMNCMINLSDGTYECTHYSAPVGTLKKPVIFWQAI